VKASQPNVARFRSLAACGNQTRMLCNVEWRNLCALLCCALFCFSFIPFSSVTVRTHSQSATCTPACHPHQRAVGLPLPHPVSPVSPQHYNTIKTNITNQENRELSVSVLMFCPHRSLLANPGSVTRLYSRSVSALLSLRP
jgi:hypothetical protein